MVLTISLGSSSELVREGRTLTWYYSGVASGPTVCPYMCVPSALEEGTLCRVRSVYLGVESFITSENDKRESLPVRVLQRRVRLVGKIKGADRGKEDESFTEFS